MALPRAELASRTAIESLFLPWVAGSGNSRSSFAETVGRSAECRRPFLSLQPRIPWGWLAAGPSPSCSSSDPAKRRELPSRDPAREIGLLGNTGEPAASMTIVGPCHDLRHTFVTPSLDSERGCAISRRSRRGRTSLKWSRPSSHRYSQSADTGRPDCHRTPDRWRDAQSSFHDRFRWRGVRRGAGGAKSSGAAAIASRIRARVRRKS